MKTKEKLIDAAIELLLQQGYESTSVSSIVQKANVAQGTFYLYFKSKYDMVLAIANRIIEDLLNQISNIDYRKHTFESFLLSWIECVYDITINNSHLINYVYSKSAEHQRFVAWEALYEPYYNTFSEMIEFYQSLGQCTELFPLKTLAKFLINVVEESAENHVLFNESKENTEDSIQFVYKFILRSLKIERKGE